MEGILTLSMDGATRPQ